jgi:hypothetical protein
MTQPIFSWNESRGCTHATRSPRDSGKHRDEQHRKLLATYAKGVPQTAEEAGTRAGFHVAGTALTRGSYWSRLSELRKAGLLAWTKGSKISSAGGRQKLSAITAEGRQALKLPPGLPVIPRK